MLSSSQLGRLSPMFLAGEGARVWAKSKGIDCPESIEEANKWLVTERAKAHWERFKLMLANDSDEMHSNERINFNSEKAINLSEPKVMSGNHSNNIIDSQSSVENASEDRIMDTVGVICIDNEGAHSFWSVKWWYCNEGQGACGFGSNVWFRLLGFVKGPIWSSFHRWLLCFGCW